MVKLVDPVPWGRSVANKPFLEAMVAAGILPPNTDPARPVWIALGSMETQPKPPSGYVVSLMHDRGFGVPAGRLLRALCRHYEVELLHSQHHLAGGCLHCCL
jgi:hypothetical protein